MNCNYRPSRHSLSLAIAGAMLASTGTALADNVVEADAAKVETVGQTYFSTSPGRIPMVSKEGGELIARDTVVTVDAQDAVAILADGGSVTFDGGSIAATGYESGGVRAVNGGTVDVAGDAVADPVQAERNAHALVGGRAGDRAGQRDQR